MCNKMSVDVLSQISPNFPFEKITAECSESWGKTGYREEFGAMNRLIKFKHEAIPPPSLLPNYHD